MRKLSLLIIFLLAWSVSSIQAQQTTSQAREAEWKSYALPQTNFVRKINDDKEFIFRLPADWKQEGTELWFQGPHSAQLRVYEQKIPEGYPLRDYFASFVRVVRDQPGAADAMVSRKTQLQDLEARELLIEIPNPEGEMIRSTSWIAVSGSLGLTVNLQVPVAHAAEVEPFLKAILQSVIFLPAEHKTFEELRTSTIKTSAPGPIHEVENLVSSLNEIGVDREAAVARLSSLFSTTPDVVVDLLVDRRPLVRAAAVHALARSNNSALQPFVWEMIDDKEPLAAEAAARSVAGSPDLIAQILKHSQSGQKIETIARIWPFITTEKRTELLQKLFSKTAVPRPSPSPSSTTPKTDVKVTITEMAPVKPGSPVPDVSVGVSNDANVQIGALTLLTTMTPDEFKLPLAQLTASNYDPLIALGLQVANYRLESLPLDPLLKLVTSSDQQVSKLAAQNLALSGSVSDIPRIEALISKDSAEAKKALDSELKLAIGKIQFRHELAAAKNQNESRQIINKALSDPALAGFAWLYDCEATNAGCGPTTPLKRDFTVKPFGANVFPKKVRHYTAIPNLGQAVQKFYETLNGLQMDSPRAQANFVYILNNVRQLMTQQWSAPAEAETVTEYTGIDLNSPIALGSWTADKALDSTGPAERRAIVLRVKDRARFERLVEQFQRSGGSFTSLTDYIAIGTRGIAALPALLPLIAQAVADRDPAKPKRDPVQSYSLTSNQEWNGLSIKSIEHHWITFDWQIRSSASHLVYVGDYVIVTPDLATMRDLVTNATQTDRQTLAENTEFRKATERRGDIVYFSDLKAVMAEAGAINKDFNYTLNESGALNIGNSTWENTHQLVFDESDWAKHLLPFHPKELTAPRDLLPASTIAYYLMNIDLVHSVSSSFGKFFPETLQGTSKLWGIDFQREVLPELGPECGAVLLELPEIEKFTSGGTWATFCKLKSNKLAQALNTGKLFNGVGPVKDFAQVKSGTDSYFFAVRNGFLIYSNSEKGLAAFDGKTSLAATRDYSKAAERVPGGIVAFGGYNLAAAVAAASKGPVEGLEGQTADAIFSIAKAFHSQTFFATAARGSVEGRSSVAMDREGRYSFADFSSLTKEGSITLAAVEPSGAPITDQNRLSSLVLRVKAKTAGPIDSIKDDIKTATQTVEQKSPQELVLTVAARRAGTEKSIQLPVKDPEFAADLKATSEFPADNEQVKKQASEIAGDDRDAWSVAQKLADWTHKNLEWKSVDSADAEKTLATREADCSEFSTLFVAMARSLGLPARLVSGLAYSGASFGGHAWVEVWVGRWIELDPTWGTHFVDATHIRESSSALITSAALNLLELEVLEARRPVEDFQKSPKALAQHLLKAIPTGNKPELEAVVDVATLTDEYMGAGTWAKMNEAERNQMSSAYRRVLSEIIDYSRISNEKAVMRLLHLEEKGDVAEAIYWLGPSDLLIKLRLVRQNDLWYLVEVLQNDSALDTVAETIRPTITTIESVRAGKRVSAGQTDFTRVLTLVHSDAAKALTAAEEALKKKPDDRKLRLLKTFALLQLEGKEEEAMRTLRELSKEDFAPAVFKLASYLNSSDDENEKKEAMALYERYVVLEPYDPRGFHELAAAYDNVNDFAKAETGYRKVLELSPNESTGYLDLVTFLVMQDRLGEAGPLLIAADKNTDENEDVFGSVMTVLVSVDDPNYAIKFAASEPQRMKKSATANLALGRMHIEKGHYALALPLLQTAIELEKEWDEPYIAMSLLHRKQSRWAAALKAADQAIVLDEEDGEAHYERACALARLGRINEAMAALEKAIEFYPDQAQWMADEKDLKALAKLPAFKKLLPPPEK